MDEPVLSWGCCGERADAARNRRHLLAVARQMIAEQGADTLTMDDLAERAGLGKGAVLADPGAWHPPQWDTTDKPMPFGR